MRSTAPGPIEPAPYHERMDSDDVVPLISDEDLERIQARLRKVGGPNVSWGAGSVLEVWLAENRMRQDLAEAKRLALASWTLVVATLALVFATAGLIWATIAT